MMVYACAVNEVQIEIRFEFAIVQVLTNTSGLDLNKKETSKFRFH